MPSVETNVEVYCSCREPLCGQTQSTTTRNRHEPCFIVEPCQKCMDKAEDVGYDKGYAAGQRDNQ